MPLVRRVPKRGFTNIWRSEYAVVNLSQLAELEGDITLESLRESGAGPGASTALDMLLADDAFAWRCFAAGLLAAELA